MIINNPVIVFSISFVNILSMKVAQCDLTSTGFGNFWNKAYTVHCID